VVDAQFELLVQKIDGLSDLFEEKFNGIKSNLVDAHIRLDAHDVRIRDLEKKDNIELGKTNTLIGIFSVLSGLFTAIIAWFLEKSHFHF
jgi:hypothetical protein